MGNREDVRTARAAYLAYGDARAAYLAYGDAVGWVTPDGRPMPLFDDLSYGQALGWLAAGRRVREIVTAEMSDAVAP